MGTLIHVIALHGITYSNEIDIVADGYQMRLVDLYKEPTLFVRYPDDEKEVKYYYPEDDPFYNELMTLCNERGKTLNPEVKVHTGKVATMPRITPASGTADEPDPLCPTHVLSSFEDATRTYEFSWRIRVESEKKT